MPAPAPTALPAGRRAWLLPVAAALAAAVALGIGIGAAVHLIWGNHPRAAVQPAGSAVQRAGSPALRNGLHGQATWAAGARAAPPITTLADQTGRRFALSSLRGRTVALAFFDSHCNQECPLEGRALAAAERSLPAADRPVLVAVSVNPLDTRASVRHAIGAWGLAGAGPWHWLMARRTDLAPVWRAYHIYVGRSYHGDIPHTEALYLIGRSGYERSAYEYPFAQRYVANDLRALARGAHGGREHG
jgi:cytochrome oxidase Cu insertion factor (SCO1/SenC/PrrC family)